MPTAGEAAPQINYAADANRLFVTALQIYDIRPLGGIGAECFDQARGHARGSCTRSDQVVDGAAIAAIHQFLQYQIREHATGDPLTVQKSRQIVLR